MKKKVFIFVILIGVVMVLIKIFSPKHEYKTEINIRFYEKIKSNDLNIIINTYGYLLDGYELKENVGVIDKYVVLYKNGKLEDYKKSDLNKYSDYIIYAKYRNKYAKMNYTNHLVMGSNETLIDININRLNKINYLSSDDKVLDEDLALGLEQEDILRRINDTAFKDLEDYKENAHDMKMFSYLDQK